MQTLPHVWDRIPNRHNQFPSRNHHRVGLELIFQNYLYDPMVWGTGRLEPYLLMPGKTLKMVSEGIIVFKFLNFILNQFVQPLQFANKVLLAYIEQSDRHQTKPHHRSLWYPN